MEGQMQFSFEVDPNLDVAIGVEADLVDQDQDGIEDFEITALGPTEAKPGSEDKVRMLTARYAAGLPLWHGQDCYDHGPAVIGSGDDDDEFTRFDFDDEL
jgi:hypothetical protein